jgi:pantetheine-phosphate adenylyltransferase
VEAELWSGLLADYAVERDSRILVKGLRHATDFDQEYQMAAINKGLCGDLETVFLPASAEYQHFSSTMAREMIRYGQPLEKYIPAPVAEALKKRG